MGTLLVKGSLGLPPFCHNPRTAAAVTVLRIPPTLFDRDCSFASHVEYDVGDRPEVRRSNLGLLDLSSVSDCVDHNILVRRLMWV